MSVNPVKKTNMSTFLGLSNPLKNVGITKFVGRQYAIKVDCQLYGECINAMYIGIKHVNVQSILIPV